MMVRVGEWVMARVSEPGGAVAWRIGIFQGWLDEGQTASVTLVDRGTGLTVGGVVVGRTEMAMPKAKDLPPSRVAHLSAAHLKALGYD